MKREKTSMFYSAILYSLVHCHHFSGKMMPRAMMSKVFPRCRRSPQGVCIRALLSCHRGHPRVWTSAARLRDGVW